MDTTVAVHFNIHVQFSSHICPVIYLKMCSVPIVTCVTTVTSFMAYVCICILQINISKIGHMRHICPIWWAYMILVHIWQ